MTQRKQEQALEHPGWTPTQRKRWEGLPPRPKERKPREKSRRKRSLRGDFSQTAIGHYIRQAAPEQYEVLTTHLPPMVFPAAEVIERIGYVSGHPAFRLPHFRRLLLDYRAKGKYSNLQPKDISATDALRIMELRKNMN